MKESKSKDIVKYILENYDVQNADDVTSSLKICLRIFFKLWWMLNLIHKLLLKTEEISLVFQKKQLIYIVMIYLLEILSESIEDIYVVWLYAIMILLMLY